LDNIRIIFFGFPTAQPIFKKILFAKKFKILPHSFKFIKNWTKYRPNHPCILLESNSVMRFKTLFGHFGKVNTFQSPFKITSFTKPFLKKVLMNFSFISQMKHHFWRGKKLTKLFCDFFTDPCESIHNSNFFDKLIQGCFFLRISGSKRIFSSENRWFGRARGSMGNSALPKNKIKNK